MEIKIYHDISFDMGDVFFVAVCVRVPALFFVSAIVRKCWIRIGRHDRTQRSFSIQESKRNGIGITQRS